MKMVNRMRVLRLARLLDGWAARLRAWEKSQRPKRARKTKPKRGPECQLCEGIGKDLFGNVCQRCEGTGRKAA